jgi:hypothetical protein
VSYLATCGTGVKKLYGHNLVRKHCGIVLSATLVVLCVEKREGLSSSHCFGMLKVTEVRHHDRIRDFRDAIEPPIENLCLDLA